MGLLLLAIIICLFATLTTSYLLARTGSRAGSRKFIWISSASLMFGSGAWATHFVAMLSHKTLVAHSFAFWPTLLSLCVILTCAPIAFLTLKSSKTILGRLIASALLSAGIASMHYIGMLGFHVEGDKVWNNGLVALSIVSGTFFTTLACAAPERLSSQRGTIARGLWLFFAICTPHFLGTAAMTIIPSSEFTEWNLDISPSHLALLITFVMAAILQAGTAFIYMDFLIGERLRTKETELKQYKSDLTTLSLKSASELNSAYSLLSNVMENIPASILIFDKDHRLVLSNKAAKKFLYFLGDKLVKGLKLRDYFESIYEAKTDFNAQLAKPDRLQLPDKDEWVNDRLRWFEQGKQYEQKFNENWTRITGRRLDDGTYMELRVDITEMKEREAKLIEAQKQADASNLAKSQFLATMSHEIRTPMNGMLGMAQILQKTDLPDKSKMFVDVMIKSGNSLVNIINDILDFSKIEAGAIELELKAFSLPETIDDIVGLLSSSAEAKGIELRVDYAPNLPETFIGDAGRIRQVFINLVGNAIKFTKVGHVMIHVGGEVNDDTANLEICVEDTGIGIPESHIKTVFQKFSQVDQSPTRAHEGTGLGLSIVASLIEHMGGNVSVESVVGSGSVFTIQIPLKVAASEKPAHKLGEKLANKNILLVDGNDVTGAATQSQLKDLKARCVIAKSANMALQILSKAEELKIKIEAIVIDIGTANLDVISLISNIKSNTRFKFIPIVTLSVIANKEKNEALLSAGAKLNLIKPLTRSKIYNGLVEAIGDNPLREAGDAHATLPKYQKRMGS